MSTTLKVLLVGQNDDSLASLKEALNSDELEIAATASLGPAALTWAKIVEPDLVVVLADDSVARPIAVRVSCTSTPNRWAPRSSPGSRA